jgi:hypothetical protein
MHGLTASYPNRARNTIYFVICKTIYRNLNHKKKQLLLNYECMRGPLCFLLGPSNEKEGVHGRWNERTREHTYYTTKGGDAGSTRGPDENPTNRHVLLSITYSATCMVPTHIVHRQYNMYSMHVYSSIDPSTCLRWVLIATPCLILARYNKLY